MSKKYVALRDFPMSRNGFTIIQVLTGEAVDVPDGLVDGLVSEGFVEAVADGESTDAARLIAEAEAEEKARAEAEAAAKKLADEEAAKLADQDQPVTPAPAPLVRRGRN